MPNVLALASRQRGVAAVELAVLLTPLVLMLFGATELGRAVYTYNVALNSGLPGMCSIHANSARDALAKLSRTSSR